ncbi:MAG TPA: class I SAM-dependent methyltransferase [Anaerolineales bacterium]|nr:class I SAM-dependent methyltransferase [Anaerolineales bacterium]
MVTDKIWKLPAIVNRFLSYRAAIPLAQEQIGVMMSILKSCPQPIESFLDLGCGDGILGAAVLGEYPASRGVLADFSDSMLGQAREALKEYAPQLVFENLDYGDPAWVNRMQAYAPFDAIVSGYSIHHQPDERKREIYAEIFALLKPGGWFVNIEHIAPATQLATDLFNAHIVEGYYAIEQRNGGTRTREEMASIYMNRPDKDANKLLSVDVQCAWLREMGFEEVDCYFRIYELAVFAGRKSNRPS